MKLLVVEDEHRMRSYLHRGLTERGFRVDTAENGDAGLHLALTEDYAVVILDVMLPKRDGQSVIRDLRASGKPTPALFLTAHDSVPDKVKDLELGAHDYLVKPFAFSELLARLESILRLGPSKQPEILRIADLEVDLLRHRVMRSGRRIDLTPKEFLLLTQLARRVGEVQSRILLAEHLRGIDVDSDTKIVDVHISRLRVKLDGPFENKLVHTVRGLGYLLEERN
jgi:two-component system, OmpR family, copper resistance phosphate regulon response regulator CusR